MNTEELKALIAEARIRNSEISVKDIDDCKRKVIIDDCLANAIKLIKEAENNVDNC